MLGRSPLSQGTAARLTPPSTPPHCLDAGAEEARRSSSLVHARRGGREGGTRVRLRQSFSSPRHWQVVVDVRQPASHRLVAGRPPYKSGYWILFVLLSNYNGCLTWSWDSKG
ncbi:hypothetical protein VPH35_085049 [Triticum aestivum]